MEHQGTIANAGFSAQTSDRINKLGPGKCEYIIADLKDKAGCQALCAEVAKRSIFLQILSTERKILTKTIADRLTVLLNNSGATW